jgi:hypothetical protein
MDSVELKDWIELAGFALILIVTVDGSVRNSAHWKAIVQDELKHLKEFMEKMEEAHFRLEERFNKHVNGI